MFPSLTNDQRNAWLKYGLLVVVALLIPLLQTYTLYNYLDQNVDESEMVLYAIGFFGGDLDPHWYGYGTIGMYLLFVVYLFLGLLSMVFGQVETLHSYAWGVFDGGYFYQVGRYVFAAVLAGTVMIYARMLERLKLPWPAIVAFAVFCFFSLDSLLYANYIRTDTMCALFVAIATYATFRSEDRIWVYVLAVASAGALAAKINSVSMLGLLGVVGLYRWWRGPLKFWDMPALVGTYLMAAFLFHPAGFIAIPKTVYHMLNYVDTFDSATRENTHTLVARLASLGGIFLKFMNPITLWSLLLLPLAIWRYRAATVSILLAQFFFVLPFAISPELRDYWFVPSYHAVRLLALLSWWALLVSIQERMISQRNHRPLLAGGLGVLFLVFVLLPNARQYHRRWQHGTQNTHTNILAKAYLEDEVLKHNPVYLDGHFNHVLPKVYNPDNMDHARKISRVFYFDRDQNAFLREGFDAWVRDVYGPRVFGSQQPSKYHRLEYFRVDMYPQLDDIFELEIKLQLATGEQLSMLPYIHSSRHGEYTIEGDKLTFKPTLALPWIIFKIPDQLDVLADGSAQLQIDLKGVSQPNGKVYFKLDGQEWSEAYTHMFKLNLGPDQVTIPTYAKLQNQRFVKRLYASDFTEEQNKVAVQNTVFVTSPAIYNRFMKRKLEGLSPKNAAQMQAFQQHYKYLFEHGTLVKRVRGGSGSPIEIYRIQNQHME